MEKELERAISMFKKMQFDFKMEEVINDLEKLTNEQNQNSKDTEKNNLSKEELENKQDEINEKYENIKQELAELNKLNNSLENPEKHQMKNLFLGWSAYYV